MARPNSWLMCIWIAWWSGAKSLIHLGVEFGDDCTVGAGAIVTKTISPGSVAVGNPARVISIKFLCCPVGGVD